MNVLLSQAVLPAETLAEMGELQPSVIGCRTLTATESQKARPRGPWEEHCIRDMSAVFSLYHRHWRRGTGQHSANQDLLSSSQLLGDHFTRP